MKQLILHIIQRDKFTSGYINFMEIFFPELEHVFFTQDSGFELEVIEEADVRFFIDNISFCKKQKKLIESCDKIIISGLFFKLENQMLQFSKNVWNKIYLQFWGGDFYQYKENITNAPDFDLNKELLLTCVTNCAGVINLVENDYSELKKILSIQGEINHFVAEVPSNPKNEIDFKKYHALVHRPYRIFIGNSATCENRHLEAFDLLSKYKDEDIQIVCPLSYGEEDYKKLVISEGKRIFGNKFLPVTNFYNYFDYVDLLSTATIGVYNNDRQQALGNIALMLALGKKIYIKSTTPMWKYFMDNGAECNDISDVKNQRFEDFVFISENSSLKNYRAALAVNNYDVVSYHWNLLFNDKYESSSNELFEKWHKKTLIDLKVRRMKLLLSLSKKLIKNLLPYGFVNYYQKKNSTVIEFK